MSLSNVFLNALSNTLLGMGTVFVVLIIIIFVIMLMSKAVHSIEGKGKEKEAPAVKAPAPVPVAPVVEEEVADDLELVAVITAAVAASMGSSSTDGFVVRSIKRAKNRNW